MRRSLLATGAVALAGLMAACGSDSSSSDTDRAPAREALIRGPTSRAAEETTTVAGGVDLAAARRSTCPARPSRRRSTRRRSPRSGTRRPASRSTTAAAARARAARTSPIRSSTSRAPTPRTRTEDVASSRVASSSTSRPSLAPITRHRTTSTASTSSSCRRRSLAKIFQREIKKWNDPAIAADNPGAKLPDADIVVARPLDGSGTTTNFTKFLDVAAARRRPGRSKSGSTVEWPADTQAGKGNGGVAQIVKSTPGAIGYVDLSDAKASGLKFASVENNAGKFVEPTLEAASAAAEGIEVKTDLTFFTGMGRRRRAYPIAAQTWIHRVREADRQGEGRRRLKAYLKLHAHRRPEAARPTSTSRRSRVASGTRRSRSSTRSEIPVLLSSSPRHAVAGHLGLRDRPRSVQVPVRRDERRSSDEGTRHRADELQVPRRSRRPRVLLAVRPLVPRP